MADMCAISRLSVDGNDLDHAGHSQTLLVGMRIDEFAEELVIVGINKVVVCQVVRRQSWQHIMCKDGSTRDDLN